VAKLPQCGFNYRTKTISREPFVRRLPTGLGQIVVCFMRKKLERESGKESSKTERGKRDLIRGGKGTGGKSKRGSQRR